MRRFFYDTEFIEAPCSIDLVSIGVVGQCADEEFYAVSNEFDASKADNWVKNHVLSKLPPADSPLYMLEAEIARKLLEFLKPSKEDPVELWGYYADYDHVALCWLFGRMIDLPKGMPMFTLDIKQLAEYLRNPQLPAHEVGEHNALHDARWNRKAFEFLVDLNDSIGGLPL